MRASVLETSKWPEGCQADGQWDFLSDLQIRVPKPVSLGAVSITPGWCHQTFQMARTHTRSFLPHRQPSSIPPKTIGPDRYVGTPTVPELKRLSQEDHLSLGVQGQPGKHSKTTSQKEKKKKKSVGPGLPLSIKLLRLVALTWQPYVSLYSWK